MIRFTRTRPSGSRFFLTSFAEPARRRRRSWGVICTASCISQDLENSGIYIYIMRIHIYVYVHILKTYAACGKTRAEYTHPLAGKAARLIMYIHTCFYYEKIHICNYICPLAGKPARAVVFLELTRLIADTAQLNNKATTLSQSRCWAWAPSGQSSPSN